jgi:hypothetical protein
LIDALEAAGAVKILESFWLAELGQTAPQVRDAVGSWLDSDDSVAVIELKQWSDWATDNAIPGGVGWLRTHVHY